MSYFLSSLPLWLLIAVIVVIPTVLAMGAQILIRKRVGVDKLVKNNEIAGFKFATVGVIYAVLLAFTVIVVWEKFNDAQSAVAEEAGATGALFHYAEGKEPEARGRADRARQLPQSGDRRRMACDGARNGEPGDRACSQFAVRGGARPQSERREDTADMGEVFRQLDNVTAARRVRLHLATGLVPERHMDRALHGRAPDRRLHAFLRQRESARTGFDDWRSVGSRHHGPSRDHLDRPSVHRPVYIHPDALALVLADHNRENELQRPAFASPPEAGRRQFNQRAVRIAHIEAHPATGPAILADDVHAALGEPLAPGVEIIGADREREVQTAPTVVPGNRAARIDDVLLGRAGLKHQQTLRCAISKATSRGESTSALNPNRSR